MNRLAILVVVVAVLAVAGVCYVAWKPGALSTPAIDRSSRTASESSSAHAVRQPTPTPTAAARSNGSAANTARLHEAPSVPAESDGEEPGTPAPLSAAPGGEAPRRGANESAAIATLRNVASAQAMVQGAGVIDRNGNGAGEYGFFAELAGTVDIVGRDGRSARMKPPVLAARFGRVQGGQLVRSGYVFQMYLPGADAAFVAEGGKADPGRSEALWCCYAWPEEYGRSGERAWFVNQTGEVLECGNSTAKYSGRTRQPSPSAAFRGASKAMDGAIAANAVGAAGEIWVVVD